MSQRPKIGAYTDGVVSARLTEISWYEFMWACKKSGLSPEQAVAWAVERFINAVKQPQKGKSLWSRVLNGIDRRTQVGIKRRPKGLDWPT